MDKYFDAYVRQMALEKLKESERKEQEAWRNMCANLPELYKYTALDDYEDAMQGKRNVPLQ